MICPKCGREVPYGTVCSCSGSAPLSSNPAVNVLKTVGSSPLFLTAAILYSVSTLISVFSSVIGNSNVSRYLMYALSNMDIDYSMLYPMIGALNNTSVGLTLLFSVPAILLAVGMWLFFVTCRDRRSGNVSTAGLTICKVISIIFLVCYCILSAFMLFAIVMVLVGGSTYFSYSYDLYGYGYDSGYAAGVTAGVVFVFLLVLAVLVLFILYYVSIVRTINRIKASASSGVPDNRISRFLTAMLYITGVFSGISGLISLFSAPLTGLTTLASAACSILIAVCLGRQRQQMTILMYPPVQPAYMPVQPVQAAVPNMYAQPAAPAAPVQQAAPGQPVPAPAAQEPVQPTNPVVSAAPEQPVEAAAPVQQEAVPVQPEADAASAEPVSEEKTEE